MSAVSQTVRLGKIMAHPRHEVSEPRHSLSWAARRGHKWPRDTSAVSWSNLTGVTRWIYLWLGYARSGRIMAVVAEAACG